MSLVACIAVFPLLCTAGNVRSSTRSLKQKRGTIMGVVLDVNDARVRGARVRVEGPGFKWQGETSDAGEFTVAAPVAEYRIYVDASGFRKFESAFFKVKSGITEMINLHLEVASINGTTPVEQEKKP